MLAFVIDMRTRSRDFGAGTPFLYPLEAENRLRRIGLARPDRRAGLEDAADEIRLHLIRTRTRSWQAIVLLDLPDDARQSPIEGTLVEELARIHEVLLQPLRALGLKPSKTWVVISDALERDAITQRPLSPPADLRWQLDGRGVLEQAVEGFPVLFCESELEQIREAWGPPLIFDQDLPVDRFDRLPQKLQEDIRARTEKVRQRMLALVEGKKTALAEAQSPLAETAARRPIHCISETVLDTIARECESDLLRFVQRHIDRLPQFDPTLALRRALRRNLSLYRFMGGDLVLVRFPYRDATDADLQYSNLKLVYWLTALTEEGPWEGLDTNFHYMVRVHLERPAIAALLMRLRSNLYHLDRSDSLKGELASLSLSAWNENECLCAEAPEHQDCKPSYPLFALLRNSPDFEKWKGWCHNVASNLARLDEEATDLVDLCFDAYRTGQPEPDKHAVAEADVEKRLRSLTQALRTIRLELLDAGANMRSGNVWAEKQEEFIEQMRDWLECRPRWLQLSLCFAAALLVAAPFYRYPIEGKLTLLGCLVPWAGLAAATAAVAWLALRKLRSSIHRVRDRAAQQATGIQEDIKTNFDDDKDYVVKLCQAAMMQKNRFELEAAIKRHRHLKILHAYHRNQIDNLLQRLENTLKNLQAQQEEAFVSTEEIAVHPHLPVQLNEAYMPATYGEGTAPAECRINVGSSIRECRSRLLGGVREIDVSRDDLYARIA